MGGSSPHCPEAGARGKHDIEEAGSSRVAFSRGFACKRAASHNGGFGLHRSLLRNARGYGKASSSRKEWGECFYVSGRGLVFRILGATVVLWILFQAMVVLESNVSKNSDGLPWHERFPKMSHSLLTSVSTLKRSDLDKLPRADRDVFPDSSSQHQQVIPGSLSSSQDDGDIADINEDDIVAEKALQLADALDRIEEEEVEERKEQVQASFEDVNRRVKKAEREKFEFHERDDGELERTGQPLCIYEPYEGAAAWPFLHQQYTLYRGLSLSSRGRRSRSDDVDAVSRLSLLNDTYYRGVLCEFGAFLAIANRIDRIHKNSWIGFQPPAASVRKVALSPKAEASLVDSMRLGSHGDAVYFWVRVDTAKEGSGDFWSMCDARNAGKCRQWFLASYKRMYGVEETELPFMPAGYWADLHSWAMHTSSFMEFVLFSRIFVDSMDALLYGEHHNNGNCPLASTAMENRQCYCRMLEVLVNVWAYHSARKLIYVDPETGEMAEQHPVESRRGLMKVKWFSLSVLKGMDEDMAERADDEHPNHRWLWPHTGEVFWQGILEREKVERYNMKLEKKRRNKERLARMRNRYKQKSLGRYIKPPPDAAEQDSNSSSAAR